MDQSRPGKALTFTFKSGILYTSIVVRLFLLVSLYFYLHFLLLFLTTFLLIHVQWWFQGSSLSYSIFFHSKYYSWDPAGLGCWDSKSGTYVYLLWTQVFQEVLWFLVWDMGDLCVVTVWKLKKENLGLLHNYMICASGSYWRPEHDSTDFPL